MIYHLSLQTAAFIAGLILCLFTAGGFTLHGKAQQSAAGFPRSRLAGIVLLAIDLVWSFWLVSTMEMGEFSTFRRPFLIALPIGFLLTIRFVDEFLAVRALGILLLLAAEPLLDAAFFRYEMSRLVLTVLAYILIVLGLIYVTMPYQLRDQITWLSKTAARWRGINALGFVYGLALIALALFAY
ncbi:MAG: hypothetical protein JO354_00325 [Verrucomicrobia bacterium]|nr:hypothetical protein [Verrucomicrobiota bacterium]